MSELAQLCGVTRRALYHHYSNKADAFRCVMRAYGDDVVELGLAAGWSQLRQGGSAVDVLTDIFDVRFGEARRLLATSPHAAEIFDQAYRLARDIMVEQATYFHAELETLIVAMEQKKLLTLNPGIIPGELASLLTDGARGAHHRLPPIPLGELSAHNRRILSVILYGTTASGP